MYKIGGRKILAIVVLFAVFFMAQGGDAQEIHTGVKETQASANTPVPTPPSSMITLGMVTGSPTGTYYRFAEDIKSVVRSQGILIDVKDSKGSIENINRISSAENVSLGIVQSDVLGFLARSDEGQSVKLVDHLRLVFPFYQEEVHVFANTQIRSINDLNGKVVVVGPKGSGSWLTSINIFNIAGITPARMLRLSPEKGVKEVLLGRADAMIYVAGKPVKLFDNLEQLATQQTYKDLLKEVHFVPLESKELLREYTSATLTPQDYNFVTQPTPTVAVTAMLVSYNFSGGNTNYADKRCKTLRQLSGLIQNYLEELKISGHPKWKEVDLEAELGLWKRDECAVVDTATVSLENMLMNAVKDSK